MDSGTALEAFQQIEARRYSWEDIDQLSYSPVFNVRLDALTTVGDAERDFRLFIRIDGGTPDNEIEHELRFILNLCGEHGLTPSLENAGIELS
jgi:hypothetical protein